MKIGDLAKQAVLATPHGTRIFAYRHLRTNQVLYSLSRSLDNQSALKQLTFAGKKTIPRALRKDHWKPFFTVRFGVPQQGLKAFKKLREWRMLHELSWDPKDAQPKALAPVEGEEGAEVNNAGERTEATEKKVQRPVNDSFRTGGPRKRLTQAKLRKKKLIMNQAENSVADLAAVLLEQKKLVTRFNDKNERFKSQALKSIPKLFVDESARQERLEALNQRVKDLEASKKAVQAESGKKWYMSKAAKIKEINTQIHLTKTEYHHVRNLPEIVTESAIDALSALKSAEYAAVLREELSQDIAQAEQSSDVAVVDKSLQSMPRSLQYIGLLKRSAGHLAEIKRRARSRFELQHSFSESSPVANEETPVASDGVIAAKNDAPTANNEATVANNEAPAAEEGDPSTQVSESTQPQKKRLAKESPAPKFLMSFEVPVQGYGTLSVKQDLKDILSTSSDKIRDRLNGMDLTPLSYSTKMKSELTLSQKDEVRLSDVSVEWANVLDAEYGAEWPAEVQHLPMGYSRHTAPAEGAERLLLLEERYPHGKGNQRIFVDQDRTPLPLLPPATETFMKEKAITELVQRLLKHPQVTPQKTLAS